MHCYQQACAIGSLEKKLYKSINNWKTKEPKIL